MEVEKNHSKRKSNFSQNSRYKKLAKKPIENKKTEEDENGFDLNFDMISLSSFKNNLGKLKTIQKENVNKS